MDKSHNSLVK